MNIYEYLPSGNVKIAIEMAIEIPSFPIKHGGSFYSSVNMYQRVRSVNGDYTPTIICWGFKNLYCVHL